MLKRVSRRGTAILLGLALLVSYGTALAQESAGEEVILNAVEAAQEPVQAAFNMTAYVTVVDANRQPVSGLTVEDFSLHEDGLPVELLEAVPATLGANLVLVLDTSDSMALQGKVEAVKQAAATFVQNLAPDDRVAIVVFNQTDQILHDLSQDHEAAASAIGLIEAQPGSGRCLYDAAYKAGILATTSAPGRRAVILLTDGVDEMPGAPDTPCSTLTLEEVLDFTSRGTTRTPIYTLGVGPGVDQEELLRMAEESGGVSLFAANSAEIGGLFEAINQQLKNQYALRYQSTASGGQQHNLTVTVTRDGNGLADERPFVLPEPTLLDVTGMVEGESLLAGDSVLVEVLVTGPVAVTRVIFSLDGGSGTETTSPPFTYEVSSAGLEPGSHTLGVEVQLENGQQITRTLPFSLLPPPAEEEAGAAVEEEESGSALDVLKLVATYRIPIALAVIVVGGLILLVTLQGRMTITSKVVGGASGYSGAEDLTRAISMSDALATLIVRASLTLLPGQPFDLSETLIRLGRGADNDIVVPDDPVSRAHAEIRLENGEFRVFDVGSKFGTAVSGRKVGEEGLPLTDGDELVLGLESSKPTRFSFSLLSQATASSAPGSEEASLEVGLDEMGSLLSDDDTVPADGQ